MDTAGLPRLDGWRLDIDDRDELVLVGEVDGRWAGGPLSSIRAERQMAWTKSGDVYVLGTPDPAAGEDPYAPPPGYLERRRARLQTALTRLASGAPPDEAELEAAPLIDEWTLTIDDQCLILVGIVRGHPRIEDGQTIATSPVVWVAGDRGSARTLSRWYRLGRPLVDDQP